MLLIAPRIPLLTMNPLDSQSDKDEKHIDHATASVREVDTAAQLGMQGELDPKEALRVRYAFLQRLSYHL